MASPEDVPDAYRDAYEEAPPETQDAILAALERKGEDQPLLYALLGTGTPPYKMPKPAADYQQEPKEPEQDEQAPPDSFGTAQCGNCEFFYEGVDGAICSQVRGEVKASHWCRLWKAAREASENVLDRVRGLVG